MGCLRNVIPKEGIGHLNICLCSIECDRAEPLAAGKRNADFLRDIEEMPNQLEYSRTFFDRWYRPEKSAVILVGDLDPDATLALVEERLKDGATDLLITYTYRLAFGAAGAQYGFAAAISIFVPS